MKTIQYLAVTFLFLLGSHINAQPSRMGRDVGAASEKREEMESMKIAFITKRLNLSAEDAQKFWPVYNQYSDEMKVQRQARMKLHRDHQNQENLSEKDYEKKIDSELASRQQELDITKKYTAQFKQILSMRQVAELYRAEEDFKRELLQRMRERRKDDKR